MSEHRVMDTPEKQSGLNNTEDENRSHYGLFDGLKASFVSNTRPYPVTFAVVMRTNPIACNCLCQNLDDLLKAGHTGQELFLQQVCIGAVLTICCTVKHDIVLHISRSAPNVLVVMGS